MSTQPRPVVTASRILGALAILLGLFPIGAVAWEWVLWTGNQWAAYTAIGNGVLAAVALAFGIRVEKEVTPTASPRDDAGVPFVPIAIDAYED